MLLFDIFWGTVENMYPAEILSTSDLLRKALSIAPFASESTRIFLFRSLVQEGKIEDAFTLVEEMLEKGNTRSTFWGTLCKAYLKYSLENDFEGAKTGLYEYIEEKLAKKDTSKKFSIQNAEDLKLKKVSPEPTPKNKRDSCSCC